VNINISDKNKVSSSIFRGQQEPVLKRLWNFREEDIPSGNSTISITLRSGKPIQSLP